MDELNTIIKLSKFFGRDLDAVQAGGGNTSVKIDAGRMYVKASGATLRTADQKSFLLVGTEETIKILDDPSIALMGADQRDRMVSERMKEVVIDGPGLRPSIETFLHALLGKFVVHVHPVYVNALTCAENGMVTAERLFQGKINYLWVAYESPGYPLGVLVKNGVDEFVSIHGVKPEIIFLQNHGVILSAENESNFYSLYENMISKLKNYCGDLDITHEDVDHKTLTGTFLDKIKQAYQSAGCPSRMLCPVRSPVINSFFQLPGVRSLVAGGALYPDQIVYCGESPLFLEEASTDEEWVSSFKEFIRTSGYAPKVIVYKDQDVILAGETQGEIDAIEDVLEAHLKTLLLIKKKDTPLFLPAEKASYIAHWESEKYRRKLMANAGDASIS